MKWNIVLQIVFVTTLAIALSVGSSYSIEHQQLQLYNNNNNFDGGGLGKICQRLSIWEWEQFDRLQGCTVIEGSLQINMVFLNPLGEYSQNISFPDLREITGFFMSFSTPKLMSLKTLFPNLAVIRGQELVENYALLIYKMPGMQEIGLPSLTNIQRGAVWIVDNENLCYVDTVDWTKIANQSNTEGIFKNKQQCPDTCPQVCPKSDLHNDRNLCWSKDHCQVVPHITCPKCGGNACYGDKSDKQCCHPQCLGGCFGPDRSQCHVCRGVVVNNPGEGPICSDKCPFGLYEYLHRRCVSASECLNITAIAPINHPQNPSGNFSGKWYTTKDGNQMCVLECPKNTELAPNGTACISCDGTCKKNCQGRIVDSIEAARDLAGCTRITGALKIHIRRSSTSAYGTIVNELKENLDKIEEIDNYLAVTYTYSIYSLDFLANLKIIRGKELDDKKYALIVKSNDNLMELWNGTGSVKRKIIIENPNARVLFHYNPKLCQSKIWEFVNQAEIHPPAPNDNIDIGITNGDKAPCNTKTLEVDIRQKSNSTVIIRWENFRRNLTLTSHLLNYEIHYKEATGYPHRNESKFDDRDPCGDDGWNVQEQAKIGDNEVKGIEVDSEPRWENEALIANLNPYTYYALYVKAIVIQDTYSLNNNTGAESDIHYFRTYADYPSKPVNFMLASSGPDKITASWEPPSTFNGEMQSFKIWIKSVPESQALQDQRNYCEQNRAPLIHSVLPKGGGLDSFTSTTFAPMLSAGGGKDADCCSCSAIPKSPSKDQKINKVIVETDMFDIVMGNYLFRLPDGNSNSNSNSRSVSPTSRPEEDDDETNEIKKSRRRRRSVGTVSRSTVGGVDQELVQHSSTSNEVTEHEIITFPERGSHNSREMLDNEMTMLPISKELVFVKEIVYNSSVFKYSFVLDNLTHYTTYYIGIQACRAIDPNITENDTRTCSEIIDERVQTAPNPTADNIDPRTISLNVTESHRLHIRWSEPPHPNGVIMAYVIVLQKVGANKEEHWARKCVTHAEFIKNGKNYTYSDHLPPGNYSLRIQVASLAQDSEFSAVQYFFIEDIDEPSPGFWVLVILLPLVLIILAVACFGYWMIRKNYPPGTFVISPNPEYMPNVDIAEEWEVPRDNVRLLKALGQGSFGTVYEGKLIDFIVDQPDLLCAVKTVADDTPGEERALFLKEAALMTKLCCNHVVKLLGIVSKSQPIYVVMELMENGDLKQYLRSRRPDAERKDALPPPTLKQILRISSEIADGMSYIHSQRLVHRDLAARNCLVHKNGIVKVSDFGLTKEITDYYRKQTRGLLPVRWMAPESLRDGVFTSQSDVWSFGVVLWEMATLAAQPYQGLSNSQVLEFVQSGRVMDMPEKCPPILYELMSGCWQYDHRHRPTFTEILERLTPYLEPSFAQVSFYHSPEGLEYRTQASQRPSEEEPPVTIRTPLIATFDVSDDELDYDSDDDQPGLSHHIVDDLGDISSRRLLSSTPVKPTTTIIEQQQQPSTSPSTNKNGDVGSGATLPPPPPQSISGNNNGSGYLQKNGTSPAVAASSIPITIPATSTTTTTAAPPPSENKPSSLFSNPPLRGGGTILSTVPTSNNNYTEASFASQPLLPPPPPSTNLNSNNSSVPPSSTNYSIPLTPVKVNDVNKSNNKSSRIPVTYTSVTPVGQQNSSVILPKNNSASGTGGGGADSNESSKSFSANCSGDSHKFGNGSSTTGGNGFILPVTGNQRNNKTTQF